MFKDVVGWEGFYQVSPQGDIRSIARVVIRSDGSKQTWPSRPINAMFNTNGYLIVRLSRPGLRKTSLVHRLVAMAFIPNPDQLPEVNHLDGNRANPSQCNLEWCTPSQNRHHAYHVLGSIVMPKTGKLNAGIASQIRAEYVPGVLGAKRLARKYGVDRTAIRDILQNKTYTEMRCA